MLCAYMEYVPSTEAKGQLPPGYGDYQELCRLTDLFETAAEQVIPYDIAISQRPVDDVLSKPHIEGVLDQEFRWYVAEAAIYQLKTLYEVYNFGGVDGVGELPATDRGFRICGPASIALAEVIRQDIDNAWEPLSQQPQPIVQCDMRLYVPLDYTAGSPGPIDHMFVTLRTGDGWVHYIDPTAELQWGEPNYSEPFVAADLTRHIVCREDELDDMLAQQRLFPFPADDDAVWKDMPEHSQTNRAEIDETLFLANNGYGRNAKVHYVSGASTEMPYWGAYMAAQKWSTLNEQLSNLELSRQLSLRLPSESNIRQPDLDYLVQAGGILEYTAQWLKAQEDQYAAAPQAHQMSEVLTNLRAVMKGVSDELDKLA